MSEIVVIGRDELDQWKQDVRREIREEVRACLSEASGGMTATTGKVYTRTELSVYLGCSLPTVTKALNNGALRGMKVGREWRVTQEALDEYLRTRVN